MTRTLLTLLLIFGISFAQEKPYFQQDISYKMNVTLTPEKRLLEGESEITYKNNSPETLSFIWLHLYPNAYKNNSTAFAAQEREIGSKSFHYAAERDRGFIDLTSVTIENKPLKWSYKSGAIDEAKIFLKEPLKPGEEIVLNLSFLVQFPQVFSRLGHTFRTYFAATQWYPKVVVYDRLGWHPDSYLDKGEFYGEFGDFDVSITLPEKFIIDATGMLYNNPDEEAFMKQIVEKTTELTSIEDAKERKIKISEWQKDHINSIDLNALKTVRYKAKNVHDFAWFCGHDYLVHQQIQKKGVLTNVLVRPQNVYSWKDVPEYVAKTLAFYGDEVGLYQYPKASVVDGTLSAGGGMEYPMITIISTPNIPYTRALELVVAHEVGHNWFYGMLGSNERAEAWLDEGLNDYYESAYFEHYYPQGKITFLDSLLGKYNFVGEINTLIYEQLTLNLPFTSGTAQPLNLRAEDYSRSNYGAMVYSKSGAMLANLRWFMGAHNFKNGMQSYFKKWHGKHPNSNDFWSEMQAHSSVNLSTFRTQWMTTNHYNDFTISKNRTEQTSSGFLTRIYVKNCGTMQGMAAPVHLVTESGDTLEGRWNGDPNVPVEIKHNTEAEHIEVNLKRTLYETSYYNNQSYPNIAFKPFKIIPSFSTYSATLFPYLGYEYFKDGVRLGFMTYAGSPIANNRFFRGYAYYGINSQKMGYNFEYSNRLPRWLLNYSDWAVSAKDKNGLKHLKAAITTHYADPKERYTTFSLGLSAHHTKVYDMDYLSSNLYSAAQYNSVRIKTEWKHISMFHMSHIKFKAEKSVKSNNSDIDFSKLEMATDYKYMFGKRAYFLLDFYLGHTTGDQIPMQELVYAGGFVDPKHENFTPARRGNYSYLTGFYAQNPGMKMLGYMQQKNIFPNSKNGMAFGFEGSTGLPGSLYIRTGVLAPKLKTIELRHFFTEAGIKLKSENLTLAFPIYVSHPEQGENHFAFRFALKMHIPLFNF